MAKVIKIHNEYFIEYKAQGLTFRKKAGKSKEDAKALLKQIEDNAGPEEFHHATYHDVKYSDFLKEYLTEIQDQFSSQSLMRIRLAVENFNEFLLKKYPQFEKIQEATPKIFVEFQSAGGSDFELTLLAHVFGFARKKGYINDNPLLHLKKKEEPSGKFPRALNEEEVHKLLDVCNDSQQVVVELLLETGIRVEECIGLDWDQVDLKEAVLHVDSYKGNVTTEDVRVVPLSPRAKQVLEEARVGGAKRLFNFISHDNLKTEIDELIVKAGISRNVTFNSLRHTFAKNLLQRGVNLIQLSQYLGIDDILQVMIYESFLPNKDDISF